jgi:hypothetical protein
MATVLETEETKPEPGIATLIRDYAADVAELWRAAGLKPTRARHPDDPTYVSNFHRFVELVLTAMVDPWTWRHDGAVQIEEHTQSLLGRYRALPEDLKQVVRPLPRGLAGEWLVSDDHLRRALTSQKSATPTP